jgi:hypothetical protein
MDLAQIRQKIIEVQRGTGMDPALVLFIAISVAILVAVIVVLMFEMAIRRRRCNPNIRPERKRLRSVR